ncbi:LLM class flavin-dependent oxidoreductase [Actinoplanes sp. GCM10030250]|uniref:LLM class flavin-dependent oxidoreductase n=1 Tax=Actinoplanes sp. GCM10030250 TaxID=3273376 RepID=UPI00360CB8CE
MTERAFRFGVVAGQAHSGADWARTARRAEDLGYDVLLVPDTLFTLPPFAALAAAATITTRLRLGTYVLSAPNRTPAQVAWEAKSLQTLSDGRLELGLGGGRPGGERDAIALAGAFGTPGERLRRVADTIGAVRELPEPPPILIAASKPGMLRLAAAQADIVTFGLPPATPYAELARTAVRFREMAGDRAGEVELQFNAAAVAPSVDALPYWLSRQVGGDARAMAAAGGASFLIGSPDEIAEELVRRRGDGFSFVAINSLFMDQFEPILLRLRALTPTAT